MLYNVFERDLKISSIHVISEAPFNMLKKVLISDKHCAIAKLNKNYIYKD